VAIAIVYFAIALGNGGFATTAVAWGAIVVWGTVAIGIVFRAWPEVDIPPAATAAVACLAGYALLSVLSMIWADDPARAFSASLLPGAFAGLALLVILTARFVAARTWLAGIAGGIALVAIIALASRLDPGFLGTRDTAAGAGALGATGRLSYPIGYWNGLAACLAVGLVLLAWFGAAAESRLGRAVAVGLLPFGGLALFFTSSRGGVVAVVVGVAVAVALGPGRFRLLVGAGLGLIATVALSLLAHSQHDLIYDLGTATERSEGLEVAGATVALAAGIGLARWRLDGWLSTASVGARARRISLGALLVIVVVGVALSHPLDRWHDFVNDTNPTAVPGQRSLLAASGSGRAQFWHAALDAFASKPLTGVGADNYELYWNAHPQAAVVTGNAHSLFLDALADLGPLGLLLALGPFVAVAVAVRARWRARPPDLAPSLAMLATALVGATIDWTWRFPAAFIPAVVAIGLLTGPATLPGVASAPPGAARSSPSFGLGVATLLFAWGLAWIAAVVLLASYRLDSSRAALARGDLAAAASSARSAASIEPFSTEPQLQLALIGEAAGDLHEARAAAEAAIDKAPGDWRGWAIAARIERRLGRPRAEFVAAAKAQSLSPVPLPKGFIAGR
jgi:tetratricopeptide (TPR) repeat protein